MSTVHDAFISYSHKADGKLAPALERELERFGIPWYRPAKLSLFRDETSLTATPELWPTIEQALQDSRYFLLLASPRAAQSVWVQREVGWWLANKSHQTLLIALTDGQIKRESGAKDFDWTRTDALPINLKGVFAETPLWVDLRWAIDPAQLTPRNPQFAVAMADIAAPLRGLPKEALIGEEVTRRRRVWQSIATVMVIVVAALVAVGFLINRNQLTQAAKNQADSQWLAQRSDIYLDQKDFELAALLGHAAVDAAESPSALRALLQSTVQGPRATLGKGVPQAEDEYQQPIRDVAFSPESDAVVSLEAEGMLRVWQWPSISKPGAERDVGRLVHAAVVSPDGTAIMAIGSTEVSLWDFSTLEPLCRLMRNGITSAAFAADGKKIYVGANADVLRAETTASKGGDCTLLEPPLSSPPDAARVSAVAASTSGWVVAGREDGSLSLWRGASDSEPIHTPLSIPSGISSVQGSTPGIHRLAFNPARTELVAATDQGELVRWDLRSDDPGGELLASTAAVIDEVTFDMSGSRLAIASRTGKVRIWETAQWTTSDSYDLELVNVLSVAISPDFTRLATGGLGDDGATRLWNLTVAAGGGDSAQNPDISGITAIAFDAKSQRLVLADANQTVRVCEAVSDHVTCEPAHDTDSVVNALAFSPAGEWLAIGEESGAITLINLVTGESCGVTLDGYRVKSLAFSADGSTLASTGERNRALGNSSAAEKTINLWRVGTLEPRDTIPGDSAGVTVAFSPQPSLLVAVGGNQAVAWTETNGMLSERKIVGSGTAPLKGIAISHDGSKIASGAADGSIYIWDAVWGDEMSFHRNPPLVDELVTTSATSVAFSPDDRYLASGHADGSVALWSIEGHGPIGLLGRFDSGIAGVRWTDQDTVMGLFADGNLVELQAETDDWKLAACEVAGRDLTPEEAELYLEDATLQVCRELFGTARSVTLPPLST